MDLVTQLQALEKRVSALEKALSSDEKTLASNKKEKSLSIREFINQLKPSTANDVAIVIGYYHEVLKEAGFFTNEDLKMGFSQAKMIAPKNISDVIAKNAKKGYIMPHSEQSGRTKEWVLTNTGEEYINSLKELDD